MCAIPLCAVWADAHDQHSPLGRLPDSQDAQRQPTRAPAAEPAAQQVANLVICEDDDAASVASDASTVVHNHSSDRLWEEQAGGAEEDRGTAEAAAPSAGPPAAQPAAAGELAAEPAELPDLAGAGAASFLGSSSLQLVCCLQQVPASSRNRPASHLLPIIPWTPCRCRRPASAWRLASAGSSGRGAHGASGGS